MIAFDLKTVMDEHGGKCVTVAGHKAEIIKQDYGHPSAKLLVLLTNPANGDQESIPYYTDGRPFRKHERLRLMIPEERITKELWIGARRDGSFVVTDKKPDPENLPPGIVASQFVLFNKEVGEHK